MTAVFDSNILIDFLSGIPEARQELRRHRRRAISVITWIEVLAGAQDEDEDRRIRGLLARFTVRPLGEEVRDRAVYLRRTTRLKVPDAIIRATADELGWILVTRNTKDFPASDPGIRVPYTL